MNSTTHRQLTGTVPNISALPIVVNGQEFYCDGDRMWNLTDMHKALGLPNSKSPYNWRTVVSKHLAKAANLRVLGGRNGGTWATEEAAIAYAMWVSVEFYLTVVRAFIAIRNDNITKAKQLAGVIEEIQPISDTWLFNLKAYGRSLTDCLRVLQFNRTRKVLAEFKKYRSIRNPFYIPHEYYPERNMKGCHNGYWREPRGDGRYNDDGLLVTPVGFEWLKENQKAIQDLANRRKPNGTLS
ncbi:KilA-N domain-containing protein [Edwardsiella tarda]|uniref:KilA-N domain-containing protein n=1 Tax=Edwardsiella tarda TaxID=636 RepID=UPI00266F54DD|nr:KilA-N domain-containing protein [Edwardsiella tarda]WKS82672.1 KilA-N domain-containing protein [Edwardsiella tarda]